MIRIPDEMNR